MQRLHQTVPADEVVVSRAETMLHSGLKPRICVPMDFNDLQILPPSNWDKFEDLCLDVFREQWGDKSAQKNGRRGQAQNGTDISGRTCTMSSEVHGVQCKGKDRLYGAAVTKSELEEEVAKALTFEPPLASWTLVTTASKDAAIEREARLITARHESSGLFRVTVLGWEDLRSLIADSDMVMTKHYPDQAPRQRKILEKVDTIIDSIGAQTLAATAVAAEGRDFQLQTSAQLAQLFSLLGGVAKSVGEQSSPADAILHARIDDVRTSIQGHEPASALKQVEKLIANYWVDASASARFRLLANKAAALFNLGRSDEGAHASLEAFPFAPDDHRAIIYAAQAHLFRGEADRVRTMVDPLLAVAPDNEDAQALRIAASVGEAEVTDPYWVVPDPEAASWNVMLSVARWFQRRGRHDEASAAFQKALLKEPDQLELLADAASSTLEHLFNDRPSVFARRLSPSAHQSVLWAADCLRRVWDRVKRTEVGQTYLWVANNLSSVLRYLGEYGEASSLLSEALVLFPSARELLQQRVLVEAARGEHAEVLKALDILQSDDDEARLLRSSALEGLKRLDEALGTLNGFPQTASAELRIAVVGSRVKLLVELDRAGEALDSAQAVAAEMPRHALARLVVSDAHRRLGNKALALEHAQAALPLLRDAASDDGLERMFVAEALGALGDWETAATLLADAGDARVNSEPLRLRVEALLHANRRRELRELLAAMPSEVASLPPYARAGAWLYRMSGDYAAARACLDAYLAGVPGDLGMRMLWLDVLERQGDTPGIKAFLGQTAEHLRKEARTRDVVALSQFMARHGHPARALELGYRTLRDRWTSPTAHLGYLGLVLTTEEVRLTIPTPTSIAPGVAFTVENDMGQQRIYVIETEAELKPELNEVAVGSRLAAAAMGHAVGDYIRVNDSDFVSDQRVVMLAHKHLSLLHRSLREFEGLFPDNMSLVGFNVDPAHPERFIEKVRPGLTARAAAGQEVLRQYRTTPLPLAFLANAVGLDPIDGWHAMRQAGEPIDVCLGVVAERDKANALVRVRPPLILDPMTFWIAGVLELLDALAATFGQLGLAASTVELLEARDRKARENLERGRGMMFERDGNVVIMEVSDDERRIPAELAARLLCWARRHAIIVPAIPDKDMGPEVNSLGQKAHPSVMDTVSAASGSGRLLLCEDRRLRVLAEAVGVERSAWLQSAMMVCLSESHITRGRYSDALLDLALWQHHLTPIDGAALLRATTRWHPEKSGNFGRVVENLASPTLDLESLLRVLLAFFCQLWSQPKSRGTKEALTTTVLDACSRAHADCPRHIATLMEAMASRAKGKVSETERRGYAQAARHVRRWLQGL